MAYKVEITPEASRDAELIFDFLVESYVGFGENEGAAFNRAASRIRAIRTDAQKIGVQPFRGTIDDDLISGLRHVTINRAVFYFDADPDAEAVRILAILFGGQDHRRRMLARLIGEETGRSRRG